LVLKLLVSGGVGYIGTHSIIEILNAEHDISEIDDLSKSHIAALPWVKQPARRNLAFVQADLCDTTSASGNFKRARLASTTAFQSACPRRVSAPLG
jgi:UDP-glucose 4-epimerase